MTTDVIFSYGNIFSLLQLALSGASTPKHVSRAENEAERPENQVERSVAVSGRGRKTMERSAEREVAEREWSMERAELAVSLPAPT